MIGDGPGPGCMSLARGLALLRLNGVRGALSSVTGAGSGRNNSGYPTEDQSNPSEATHSHLPPAHT